MKFITFYYGIILTGGVKMKKYIIYIILTIIIILTGIFCYKCGKKSPKDIIENDFTFLDSLVGTYGSCNESICHMIEINKENNTYIFSNSIYASDSINTGNVTRSIKLNNTKYYISVYYPALHNEMEDIEETNADYILEYVNNEHIKINNNSYKKINGDIENFFENEGFGY